MKRLTKFIATFLVFILAFSPLTSIFAGAVTYPDGVTKTQTLEVIPKLSNLVKAILEAGGDQTDLKGMLYNTLYKDDTINMLFAEMYTALGESADTLSVIGVDVSPTALSAALLNYPAISKKIASCKSLDEVIKASKNFRWEVNSKKEFSAAVAAILSPFNALLNALLCSGKVSINSLLAIQGDDGYSAAIVPLLTALDCPDIMSSADFAASAAKNRSNIVKNILSMAFAAIDRLLEDPVTGLCETLPKVALYLDSGKLSASITSLLEPLSIKVAGILTIPGVSDLITSATDLEASLNINEMIEGADFSEMLGSDVKLEIPEINLSELAACATESGGVYTVDKADAFIVIMSFLIKTIKLNKDSLGAIAGGADLSVLDPLMAKSEDEMLATIIKLFSITSAPANNYQWTYPAFTGVQTAYTPTLTADDYLKYLDKVDPLLTDFVKESDPEGTIEETLRKTIYSNSLVSTLITGIFSAIGSEEMAPVFSLLGLDVTPTGVGNAIYQYYPYTAKTLYKYSSWENVNPNYLSWGFYDGDRAGFEKAITRVLTPFIPLLSCMLAGNNVTLMGAVTIPGSDGYNTAIIPLLEALGCEADTIKTFAQYQTGAGTTAVISDILDPITALLDRICASPVKTVCTILPNLVYFMDSGLINGVIENMIYPVKYMLDTAGLGELLTDAFKDMGKIDLNSLVGDMTKDMDLGIALPEIDVTAFGKLGTATALTSKRTVNGAAAQYTYVVADTPAVFLSVLRLLVSAIAMEENSNLLTDLMGSADMGGGSAEGMPDMFAMYAGNISEKFKNMTNDEIIEWLCDLLFSETPTVEIPDEEEEIPTIIYEKKFELSTTAKIIIVLVLLAAIALTYYILSVSGKLDNLKLKRSKKQEMKRRRKEQEALRKAGGTPVKAIPGKEKATENIPAAAEEAAVAEDAAAIEAAEETVTAEVNEAVEEKTEDFTSDDALFEDAGEDIAFTKPIKISAPKVTEADLPEPDMTGIYTEEALKIIAREREKEAKHKSERSAARKEKAKAADEKKEEKLSMSKLPDEKASEKLMRRQQAAAKKALKNERKIQKQYEKAKRQAAKKNKK